MAGSCPLDCEGLTSVPPNQAAGDWSFVALARSYLLPCSYGAVTRELVDLALRIAQLAENIRGIGP